jgi:hypothetical protein
MDAALARATLHVIERICCFSLHHNIMHPTRNEPHMTVYMRNKDIDETSCIVGASPCGCPISVKLSRGQAALEADGRYSSASDAWEWSTLP